jgi:hypothetical protein
VAHGIAPGSKFGILRRVISSIYTQSVSHSYHESLGAILKSIERILVELLNILIGGGYFA